jgi:protein-serine/threonine kinase
MFARKPVLVLQVNGHSWQYSAGFDSSTMVAESINASSAASSLPPLMTTPAKTATPCLQPNTDFYKTVKGEDVEEKVTENAVLSRPLLSQPASTVESKKVVTLGTRFQKEEDECHKHSINSIRGRAKSFSVMQHLKERQMLHLASNWIKRLRKEREEPAQQQSLTNPTQTVAQKYGRCGHVLGWGAFGTVRIAHKVDEKDPKSEQLFAVKELKQHPGESLKRYYKRLTAEFCISSSLHHQNVVATLDLLQDAKGVYCQIMEYCSGGDLHTVILTAGQLEEMEADCFFKQLIRGVGYLHEMGVAHRDLKPENVLLTQRGTIKITDFGNAECFRTAWETNAHMSAGVCGSAPYIAPEEYASKEFEPRPVDVWACGVIYMAMRTGEHLWRVARIGKDASYERYVEHRKTEAGYEPIERLRRVSLQQPLLCCVLISSQRACRNVIYSTLDPSPKRRLTAHQVISSEWVEQIQVCRAGT